MHFSYSRRLYFQFHLHGLHDNNVSPLFDLSALGCRVTQDNAGYRRKDHRAAGGGGRGRNCRRSRNRFRSGRGRNRYRNAANFRDRLLGGHLGSRRHDIMNFTRNGGFYFQFHLHGFDDKHRIAGFNLGALGGGIAQNRARNRRGNCHTAGACRLRRRRSGNRGTARRGGKRHSSRR